MIGSNQLPELRTFARIEQGLNIRSVPEFGPLVVSNGNESIPCHRWFSFKEAFSSDLLEHVLSILDFDHGSTESIRLLDPYCGVGTGLLSAQLLERQIEPIGIECHPFSAFTAATKLSWHKMNSKKIRELAAKVLAEKFDGRVRLPELSSIVTGRCISRHMARQVMTCRYALETLPSSIERDALIVGLASVIIPVSRVRRDGRALRIARKRRTVFRKLLAERWNIIATDVENLQKSHADPLVADVRLGDGRQPTTVGISDESIDLILTSPPYPNNIDYNEVYKLELWFLGFITDAADFLSLRRSTYRSHPTCNTLSEPGANLSSEFLELINDGPVADFMGTVIRRVERIDSKRRRGRTKVLLGYIHDTWQSLRAHYQALRPGGLAVYVVGNSLHGGADKPYLVPTDLIFAKIGEQVGFTVDDLIVARGLQRRLTGNHFLRDSVVVLRKS